MKEKTADIDILEEKEKEAIKDLEEYLHWEELQGFSMLPRDKHIETLLNLVSTLIAENKELKEKELDYTTVYLNGVYDEREKWQKKIKEMKERNKRQQENLKIANKKIAAQRGQLMMLNKAYIPKSKVEELIEEVKEDENPSISSFQEYAQEYAIDKLQSLLGKE